MLTLVGRRLHGRMMLIGTSLSARLISQDAVTIELQQSPVGAQPSTALNAPCTAVERRSRAAALDVSNPKESGIGLAVVVPNDWAW
jgi:hypothetical protein